MGCPLVGGCAFFNDKMQNMPATTDMLKTRYCEGSYERCARYMVADKLGRPSVPGDLFPNEQDTAEGLINGKK